MSARTRRKLSPWDLTGACSQSSLCLSTIDRAWHSRGFNHQIVLWDLTKGAQIRPPFEGHSANLFCLRSCTVGGRLLLASSGQDPGIRLWDVRAGAPPAIIDTSRSCTAGLAFGPWQGQTALFSGSYRGEILVWDPEDGRPLGGDFQAHAEPINTIVIG